MDCGALSPVVRPVEQRAVPRRLAGLIIEEGGDGETDDLQAVRHRSRRRRAGQKKARELSTVISEIQYAVRRERHVGMMAWACTRHHAPEANPAFFSGTATDSRVKALLASN